MDFCKKGGREMILKKKMALYRQEKNSDKILIIRRKTLLLRQMKNN